MKHQGSVVLCMLLLATVGCGRVVPSPSPSPSSTATCTPTPTRTATPAAESTATNTSTPAPTPTFTPLVPGVGIAVFGSEVFVSHTRSALDFLAGCAPDALATADEAISTIQESPRSGMRVQDGTFLVSETTAFAPGYSQTAQVFWYAGVIVHDARHAWQSVAGITTDWDNLTLAEREAIEADARGVEISALQRCSAAVPEAVRYETDNMLKYLTDMQDGIIPCDYCATEWADRFW